MKQTTQTAHKVKYRLHPKQGMALRSKATEILFGGAAGGGKSFALRLMAIIFAFSIAGIQIYLFRRTFPGLLKNHMEGESAFPALLMPWVQTKALKINWTAMKIRFGNGSLIHLCHCQHEKDVYNYQGAEIHLLLIDESTHFTAKQIRFLRSRVRMVGVAVPDAYKGMFPRIVYSSNPGGVSHNYFKEQFVTARPPLDIWRTSDDEGGMLRQYIPARITDNPSLTENDPAYLARLRGLGDPQLVKAMEKGDWDIVAGGMFNDIWDSDIHIIEPFRIPDSWYVNRSFDWGAAKPFSVGWYAESDGTEAPNGRHYPHGTVFRIAEWYGVKEKDNGSCEPNVGIDMLPGDIAKGILEIEKRMGYKVNGGVADPSIWTKMIDKSIFDEFLKAGVSWRSANNERVSGWTQIKKMLKACIPPIDEEKQKVWIQEEPGVFAFNTCRHFIRTFPELPRDSKKPDDIDTNVEDHIADEFRYRIMDSAVKHSKVKAVGF